MTTRVLLRDRTMQHALEGIYTYAEFAGCALAWLPVLAAKNVLHRHDAVPRIPGRSLRLFGRTVSSLTPLWKFSVEGTPPADIHSKPYVVVANHASIADPFLLSSLDWDMQWVVKQELYRMPVAGWLIRLGGDIPLRRGEGESVRAMFAACRHALQNGLSVMIFPEGTRSKDGSPTQFKDGAFRLALDAGVPILPIAIGGTHGCMPKGARWFGRAHAIARILEPIATEGVSADGVSDLRDRAQAQITENVAQLEAMLDREIEAARSGVAADAR